MNIYEKHKKIYIYFLNPKLPYLIYFSCTIIYHKIQSCSSRTLNQVGVQVWQKVHTEPLKVRNVFTSSSSEKTGCRATRFRNLPRARLRPSMNSRSDMEVRTAAGPKNREKIKLFQKQQNIVLPLIQHSQELSGTQLLWKYNLLKSAENQNKFTFFWQIVCLVDSQKALNVTAQPKLDYKTVI